MTVRIARGRIRATEPARGRTVSSLRRLLHDEQRTRIPEGYAGWRGRFSSAFSSRVATTTLERSAARVSSGRRRLVREQRDEQRRSGRPRRLHVSRWWSRSLSFTPKYGRLAHRAPRSRSSAPDQPFPDVYLTDVQAKYPSVDWQGIDRLYIPAGNYKSILLGNLPKRPANKPLVITNLGGVKIGGQQGNFLFSLQGGANWILTGRYDPDLEDGRREVQGHAEAASCAQPGDVRLLRRRRFSKTGLTGLSIGGKATDFEIDCIEIARAEFAGIVAKTDNDGTATMKNVKLHDAYIHDTGSEGIYFGSTSRSRSMRSRTSMFYDNRMLRTGTEALQTGQLGAGCRSTTTCSAQARCAGARVRAVPGRKRAVRAALRQLELPSQRGHRHGDLFVELFPTHVEGDTHGAGDTVTFSDNYFSDSSSSGVFTHADENW